MLPWVPACGRSGTGTSLPFPFSEWFWTWPPPPRPGHVLVRFMNHEEQKFIVGVTQCWTLRVLSSILRKTSVHADLRQAEEGVLCMPRCWLGHFPLDTGLSFPPDKREILALLRLFFAHGMVLGFETLLWRSFLDLSLCGPFIFRIFPWYTKPPTFRDSSWKMWPLAHMFDSLNNLFRNIDRRASQA